MTPSISNLATDPAADPKRNKAALGDLRLSIGNLKGTPTAVVYRMVANDKHPKTFTSGVVKDYTVDSVLVMSEAVIQVRKEEKRYVVEATIPLAALGIKPVAGTKLRGDFGVTFGDASGQANPAAHRIGATSTPESSRTWSTS